MSRKEFPITILVILILITTCCGCIKGNPPVPASISPTPIPESVDLHTKGFNAFLTGNYTLALNYYNQSLVTDPKNTRAWVDMGDILLKMNRTNEAIAAYDSALILEHDRADIWNSRGVALMVNGNYTAARESFEKALQIAPEYADAKNNRDLVLKKIQGST